MLHPGVMRLLLFARSLDGNVIRASSSAAARLGIRPGLERLAGLHGPVAQLLQPLDGAFPLFGVRQVEHEQIVVGRPCPLRSAQIGGLVLRHLPQVGYSSARYIRSSYKAPVIFASFAGTSRVGAAIECVSTALASFQISITVKWFGRLTCWTTSKRRLPSPRRPSSPRRLRAATPSSLRGGMTATGGGIKMLPQTDGASIGPMESAVWTRSSVGALRMAAIFSRVPVVVALLTCASNAAWSFQISRTANWCGWSMRWTTSQRRLPPSFCAASR